MMRKLPWFLLAVSIIFNFTFAGGFLQARSDALVAEGERSGAVADELDLTDEQKEAYTSLRAEAKDRATELREAILLARQDLWAQIRSSSPDREKIQQTQKQLGELYQEYRELAGEHLQQFLGVLRPDQRRMVIDKIQKHDRHHHSWSAFWGRFDTNKDGKLDEAERKKAHESMKSRHGRYRGRPRGHYPRTMPAEVVKKYDANGDGKLDKEEQGRMWDAFRKKSAENFQEYLLKRFDADGDGKLNDAEKEAARKSMFTRPGYPPRGGRPSGPSRRPNGPGFRPPRKGGNGKDPSGGNQQRGKQPTRYRDRGQVPGSVM